jgi:N-acetylneuraminate synthase/N,N'-diacetyllegionaminate synthase
MKIGNFDTDRKVLVIAEIGNNHEGSVSEAKKLVQAAAKAGADAVKFQTIVPKKLVSANQQERLQQLNRYALSPAHFLELHQEAVRAGVLFLSTPFDPDSVEFLKNLVPAFKIASGDSNYVELLEKIAATGKPVMVSTGLSNQAEKNHLRDFFHSAWHSAGQKDPGLALLHCVTEYPTPDTRAGLRYLEALRKWDDVTVGYSDHTLGIEAAVLAVALGARIVEKHFTLDKTKKTFRDHALSADPVDFRALVEKIRRAEVLLAPVRREDPPAAMSAARRSAAAERDLEVGHTLQAGDIIWLRPGNGFSPGTEAQLVGRVLARPVAEGILFSPEDFQA